MSIAAGASFALTRAAWLADDTDVGDEAKKAGPIAILVIVVLCIACFFLFRSMSKHMRRVREEFPADTPRAADGTSPSTVPAGSTPIRATPKTRPHAPDGPASG